jgi:hypothetical protein
VQGKYPANFCDVGGEPGGGCKELICSVRPGAGPGSVWLWEFLFPNFDPLDTDVGGLHELDELFAAVRLTQQLKT